MVDRFVNAPVMSKTCESELINGFTLTISFRIVLIRSVFLACAVVETMLSSSSIE